MKKPNCGVCGKKMVKVDLPETPYLALRNGKIQPDLVGEVGKIPKHIIEKLERLRIPTIEIVPVQFGCLDDRCKTIMTYWFRRDGKEGDLTQIVRARRNSGQLREEFGGSLEDIQQGMVP